MPHKKFLKENKTQDVLTTFTWNHLQYHILWYTERVRFCSAVVMQALNLKILFAHDINFVPHSTESWIK
jgi:hypothetical protein